MKIAAATNTIAGPEAQSNVYDRYKPIVDATTPKIDAKTIIIDKRLVHKNAVAAGVTNIATIKIKPTVCNAETVTNVKMIINAYCITVVFKPYDFANVSSNDVINNSL